MFPNTAHGPTARPHSYRPTAPEAPLGGARIVRPGLSLPTSKRDWTLLVTTVRTVVSKPAYALVALVSAIVGLTTFVASQNFQAVTFAIVDAGDLGLPMENRLEILLQQYPFVGPVFDTPTSALLVVASALFGVNISLLVYHLRRDRVTIRDGSGSALGIVFGTLGAGCAACGTVVLAAVLSLFGLGGAATLLPFEGLEFAALALATLILSIYWLADGMRGATVDGCPIDSEFAESTQSADGFTEQTQD